MVPAVRLGERQRENDGLHKKMEEWLIRCGLRRGSERGGVLEGRLLFCQRAGDAVASGSRVMGLRQPPGTEET